MATVSVITPVYNAAASLEASAKSVLTQDFSDLELILVDDGSTDQSPELCDILARNDSRVQVIHQENGGVSAARNAGLQAAKGQYLLFLDSDDFLLPGAVSATIAAQNEHPEQWVIWRYTVGSNDAAFWGNELDRIGCEILPFSGLAWLYNHAFFSMPWNKLYRAEFAKTLHFDEAFSLGEDLLFCLDYAKALQESGSGFCLLHQSLTHYVCGQNEETLSTKYLQNYCALWEFLFARLNADCSNFDCPKADQLSLHRAEMQVLAEGAADCLLRAPGSAAHRRALANKALSGNGIQALAVLLKLEQNYSPYYLPVLWKNAPLCLRLFRARKSGSRSFGRFDWAGWYLLGGRWARD